MLLLKLSEHAEKLFEIGSGSHEISKIMIKNVIKTVKDVDQQINKLISENKAGFVVGNYLESLFACLEKVLKLTLVDEHMANYFVVECKGFEFILDHLNINNTKV